MRKKRSFYTSEKEQTVTDYELNLVFLAVFLWNIYISFKKHKHGRNVENPCIK